MKYEFYTKYICTFYLGLSLRIVLATEKIHFKAKEKNSKIHFSRSKANYLKNEQKCVNIRLSIFLFFLLDINSKSEGFHLRARP